MDLRQLRYFVTVADSGSISAAAALLYVAQSAVSRQMRRLEEELGGELFERSAAGVCLTDSGHMLLNHARFILRGVESATSDVSSFNREMHGTVRMAAPPSVARALYATAARQFRTHYPKVKLELRESPSDEVLRRLSAGLLDIGIVSEPVDLDYLALTPLLREQSVLLCPPGSAPAGRASIDVSELKAMPVIISAGLRRLFVQRYGEFHPEIQIDGGGATVQLVLTGIGYAVMPQSTVSTIDSLRGLVAVPIEGFSVSRALALIKGRPVSLATRAFRATIEAQVARCIEAGLFSPVQARSRRE